MKPFIDCKSPFFVGDIHVLPAKNLVEKSDGTEEIQPKLMEVLCYLCERAGQVVSGDELIDACWQGQYFSDSPIHKAINRLRGVFEDNPKDAKFIKTVARKGYMIVAKIEGVKKHVPTTSVSWTSQPPYVGSRPFHEEENAIFFGREQVIGELVNWIIPRATQNVRSVTHHGQNQETSIGWLSLAGPKRCGKTSLIEVGLKPEILGKLPSKIREIKPWFHFDLHGCHSEKPHSALLSFLVKEGLLPTSQSLKDYTHMIENPGTSDRDDEDFQSLLNRGLATRMKHSRALIFIDHVECSFSQDTIIQAALIRLLDSIATSPHCILITAIDECAISALRQRSEAFANSHQIRVPEFSKSEIADIIQMPAAAAGLSFDYNPKSRERLDAYLIHQQQINPVPIFALQTMLARLYTMRKNGKLTYSAHNEIGGVETCLSNAIETAFQKLPRSAKEKLHTALFHFLTLSTNGDTIEPADPVALNLFDTDTANALISPMIHAGLFSSVLLSNRIHIQISHKSILSHWAFLQDWIDRNSSQFYLRYDITNGTDRWLKHGKRKEFLLQDAQLIKATKQSPFERAFHLNQDEKSFIQCSAKLVSFHKKVRLTVVSSLVGLVVALGWLSNVLQERSLQLEQSTVGAENLISTILYDLKQQLEPIGKLELLEIIGTKASDYFEISGTKNLSPTALAHWTESQNIIGQVYAERQDYEKARTFFLKSWQTLESGLRKHGKETNLLKQSMLTSYWLGYIPYQQADYDSAFPFWEKYLTIANELVVSAPENTEFLLEKSYALNNLGALEQITYDYDKASDYFNQSAALKTRLLEQHPENLSLRSDLADTLSWQATALKRTGRLSDALALNLRALEHGNILLSSQPHNFRWMRRLGLLEHTTALIYYDMGDTAETYRHSELAQQHLIRQVANDPSNQQDKEQLFRSHIIAARALRNEGRHDRSLSQLNMAGELRANLGINPASKTSLEYRLEQAKLYSALGQQEAALNILEQVISLYQENDIQDIAGIYLYAQLLLTKARLLETQRYPIKPAFYAEYESAFNRISAIAGKGYLEPRHRALLIAMRQHLTKPKPATAQVTSGFYSEYRNPDFITSGN